MTFMIGDKVVYPSHGPCLIGAVIKRTIAGKLTHVYPLSFLDDSGNAVLIPVDKFKALPIRYLLAKSEIPKLLRHLESSPTAAKNWKQRTIDNEKLLSSGSAFGLAEILESLTQLSETRALLPRDRQTLEKAKGFLICEIAEVMKKSRDAAEGEIDRALKKRRTWCKSTTATHVAAKSASPADVRESRSGTRSLVNGSAPHDIYAVQCCSSGE